MTSVRRRAPPGRCQAQDGERAGESTVRLRWEVSGASQPRRGRKGPLAVGTACAKGLWREGNTRRPQARDSEAGTWPRMDPQEVRGASGTPKPWVSLDFIQKVMGSHRKSPTVRYVTSAVFGKMVGSGGQRGAHAEPSGTGGAGGRVGSRGEREEE